MDREERNRLVLENMGMARRVAWMAWRKMGRRHFESLDDVIQEAALALVRSIDNPRFNPDRHPREVAKYLRVSVWRQVARMPYKGGLVCSPYRRDKKEKRAPVAVQQNETPLYSLASRDTHDGESAEHDAWLAAVVLRTATEEHRDLFRLRFGLDDVPPMTLEQLGDLQGCTRENARVKLKGALAMARERLAARGIEGN